MLERHQEFGLRMKRLLKDGYTDDFVDRNHYYNSKEGRKHDAEAADQATQGGTVRG